MRQRLALWGWAVVTGLGIAVRLQDPVVVAAWHLADRALTLLVGVLA